MSDPDQIVNDLVLELKSAVQASAEEIENRTYYVFSVENLDDIVDSGRGLPAVGVIFEGLFPSSAINPSTTAKSTHGAIYGALRFSVVAGDQYNSVSKSYGSGDRKPELTTLLTKIMRRVLGIQDQGVSKRPWRFLYQVPVDTRVSGAIMYLQLWEMDIVVQSQTR